MSQKISLIVDHELSVRKFIASVLPSDGFQTIEKVDENPMVILLAEDDVQVQYSIWKLLKADGFTVLTAGNGVFALEACRNHPGSVDLLLTDLEMPRMSGLELCEKIRVERPGIKVLVMSGEPWSREQVSVNGWPFLQKPFTPTALRDAIAALLGPISVLGRNRPSDTTLTARSSQGHG
jgi:CheY-like chemotaxis protein